MRPPESFIAQPIRSLQTMLRIIAEDDPALPSLIPDGIYGQETIQAVNAFQRRQGIPATGITDQNTWDSIVDAYEDALVNIGQTASIEIIWDPGKIYRRGESSPYLYLLQSMLLVLSQGNNGITAPNHSGTLDSATAQALAGFQQLAGLEPTGKLDRKTWKYLSNQFTLSANRQSSVKL